MRKLIIITLVVFLFGTTLKSQDLIPMDTSHWEITGDYLFENYKGKESIYIKGGSIKLKDRVFLNGTIEFDLYLKETLSFPGIYFRLNEDKNGEQFYVRPHQSGNPDANQAAPLINSITPWQLFYGPSYSKAYEYHFNDWTHVRLVVNENKAQVYLDHADSALLSWNLTHGLSAGEILIRGGNREALHIADVIIDDTQTDLVDFAPVENNPIPGLIEEWQVSDVFHEKLLETSLESLMKSASYSKSIWVDEGVAANISKVADLSDRSKGNTVFAKIEIESEEDELRRFEFGYSDRVVAILNGKPIYWGTNRWKSRDYRYLGTVGLFDAVDLDLKKGNNTLLFAVSEDFGGWLITGRFNN